MAEFYPIYMTCWAAACLLALALVIRRRRSCTLFQKRYWTFLLVPWKIGTFLVAGTAITVVAPYTGDFAWDYVDASVMSVLCFLTAPWSVGTLYKTARLELTLRQGYVALCVWMFSASWLYDTWLLIRDGVYPVTMWLPNLLGSSGLYALGGLFWNLDWQPGRGTTFAFMEEDWPQPQMDRVFSKILWIALVFMAAAGCIILFYLADPLDSY